MDRLSVAGRAVQDANSLSTGYKFCQGLDLHFLHHPVPVSLDGAFGATQRVCDLLVSLAPNDEFKDLPLARRQCRDMSTNRVQLALQGKCHCMMRNRALNRLKKSLRWYRLGQKIIRTRLNGLHGGSDVRITSEEYYRQRRAKLAQTFL